MNTQRTVHFAVSPRLAALLGETYRFTEAALKELVDNGWDADADNIWVTLPTATTADPIVIVDDGSGMSPAEVESEYLEIARDRRSKKGDHSPRYHRRIKGRKGIGKFAGLATAKEMVLETVRDGIKSHVAIDKQLILNAPEDLERIPLPLTVTEAPQARRGTTITLRSLDQALNFPIAERLRTLLLYEYGREGGIKIHVNGRTLDVDDLPGETTKVEETTANAGLVKLHFTIAKGKIPKHPGLLLRVSGKVVGTPQWFGLDEVADIPVGLLKRVYGEIDAEGIDGVVTSDWGALVENSKAHQEIAALIREQVIAKLKAAYSKEMSLQQGRLKQEIDRRLAKLPQHRRAFAEIALGKVLIKFYGEKQERIDTVASVVLDAMERDEYWQVLRNLDEAKNGDVVQFAEALEEFGLLELALMADSARARIKYLDELDALAANPATLEAQMHKAMEKSL